MSEADQAIQTVETLTQWGIKKISSRVIKEIQDAAYDAKITNGQMIERLWEFWKSKGALVPMQIPAAPVSSASTDQDTVKILQGLVQAGGPWTEANPLPAEVRSLMNGYARQLKQAKTRGKPGYQPGITSENSHSEPLRIVKTDESTSG
jgi:hypothetical protein